MKAYKSLLVAAGLMYLSAVLFMALDMKTAAYLLFISGSLFLVAGRTQQNKEKKEQEKERKPEESEKTE